MTSVNLFGLPCAGAVLIACAVLAAGPAWAQPVPAAFAASSPQAEGAEPDAPRFDILMIEVEGNTVLPARVIERVVMPFVGLQRTLNDVEQARAALEAQYQGAGYLTVFVDVPEQRVAGGTVRLKVLEGRIERLMVSGSRYYSQGYIRAQVGELADGRVPNFNEAQRQLAAVNRSDDRRVQPVLRPGRLPGTVEVELKVADQLPVEGSVELHNDHSPSTDPYRLQAAVRYGNLFQRDHSFSFTAITAPREPQESTVLLAGYTVPLESGASLALSAAYSNSDVETLGGTSAVSNGTTLGLRYLRPFGALEGSAHSYSVGFDYKDTDETTDIATPLRYLPFQLGYNGFWFGQGGRNTQLSANFTAAFRELMERKVDCLSSDGVPLDQFACKRYGGDGGFAKLVLDVRHVEPLGWGTSLALRLGGQLADTPLPSAEQYAVGGNDTVRGYLEGEGSGDRGVLGSAEWRSPNLMARLWPAVWATPPAASSAASSPASVAAAAAMPAAAVPAAGQSTGVPAAPSAYITSVIVHGFVDVARTDIVLALPGQAERIPMLGTGVGLRLMARGGLEAGLDVAWPLKSTYATAAHNPRAHARVKLKF